MTTPGTDHAQSGVGCEFLGCSSPTGTGSYPQAAAESQLKIDSSLFPASYCVYDPGNPFGCSIWASQRRFNWYTSGGSLVVPTSCSFAHDGLSVVGRTCKMPIAAAALGQYRGTLCRTAYPSSTCVETLLTVYFDATS